MRRLALLAALLAATGCGGSTETLTVTERETVTTAPASAPSERAFPSEVDAAVVQDLLATASEHPQRVRLLTVEARQQLALLRRYASEGVEENELGAVGSAIARVQCELQLFRAMIAELRRQGDPSWRTLCDV